MYSTAFHNFITLLTTEWECVIVVCFKIMNKLYKQQHKLPLLSLIIALYGIGLMPKLIVQGFAYLFDGTSALIRPLAFSTKKWLEVPRWASSQSVMPSLIISFRPFYVNENAYFLTTKRRIKGTFISSENASKLTYSNLGSKKNSGGYPD